MNRRLVGWFWGAALAPVAWLVSSTTPNEPGLSFGLPTALGCSGSGNAAPRPDGWTSLRPSMMSGTEREQVSVATDGFFVIDAETVNLSAEAARDSLQVKVTNAGGEEVQGEVALLRERRAGWYLFSWTAKSPVAMGSSLTATLSATPATTERVGGQFPLIVAGEPTELRAPEVSFEGWRDFYHGVGEPASCEVTLGCGGPQRIEFPSRFEKQLSASAMWKLPNVVGGVAWRATIEGSPSAQLLSTTEDVFLADVKEPTFLLGQLAFPLHSDERCIVVAIEDLRKGTVKKSEVCATPAPTNGAETDSQAVSCPAPPNAELTEGWCQLKAHEQHPACTLPSTDGPPTATPDSGAAPASSSRNSEGCAISRGEAGRDSMGLLVFAAASAWRRRRKARRLGADEPARP